MNKELLKKFRELALISIFADDYLMDKFVLKGGSAIELAYKLHDRSSIDLDFSIEKDFSTKELKKIINKIKASMEKIFNEEGYIIFDFKFKKKPRVLKPYHPDFWGGYKITFKIIEKKKKQFLYIDIDRARREAIVVGDNQKKIFHIDISKNEYCQEKEIKKINHYAVYVYTPKMIIIEKLRAICQQMKEYKYSFRKPRPKDFYDIYVLGEAYNISLDKKDIGIIKKVFKLKEVPIELLGKIKNYKEEHKLDLDSLKDTVSHELKPFEVYFEYVVNIAEDILNKVDPESFLAS